LHPAHEQSLLELASAYEGVEDPSGFADDASLTAYRQSLLKRSRDEANFIEGRLPASATLLELGTGNGRLLVELASRGRLARAKGIDTSKTRIDFATQWASDEGHTALEFSVEDAVEAVLGEEAYDAVVCITGAFGYFEAARSGLGANLLARIRRALRPGGVVVLELYPVPLYRRLLEAAGGEVRVWRELPSEDPWRFYLSDLSLDGGILTHHKTFIHRTSGDVDTGRSDRLYLYDPASLGELLEQAGMTDFRFFDGWTQTPYRDGELLIATARRPTSA